MGFFDKYPNTDFHELNLDWVIAKINNLKAHIKTYDDQIEGLGEAVNEKANTDDLSDVAFSGDYDDLTNKPNIPDVSDYYNKQAVDNMLADKANSSDLATVATTGNYNDLSNKPTIPAAQVNSDWNAVSGVAQILNKPTIPAAQVNSDWNAVSGVAQILNKPSLATVATSGDYDDLTNKPTIPTKTSDLTNNSGFIKAINISNGLIASGETIASKIYDSNTPVGISIWQTQQATDIPNMGTVTTIIMNKFTPSGNYSLLLAQTSNYLYASSTGNTQVTALTWTRIV